MRILAHAWRQEENKMFNNALESKTRRKMNEPVGFVGNFMIVELARCVAKNRISRIFRSLRRIGGMFTKGLIFNGKQAPGDVKDI